MMPKFNKPHVMFPIEDPPECPKSQTGKHEWHSIGHQGSGYWNCVHCDAIQEDEHPDYWREDQRNPAPES